MSSVYLYSSDWLNVMKKRTGPSSVSVYRFIVCSALPTQLFLTCSYFSLLWNAYASIFLQNNREPTAAICRSFEVNNAQNTFFFFRKLRSTLRLWASSCDSLEIPFWCYAISNLHFKTAMATVNFYFIQLRLRPPLDILRSAHLPGIHCWRAQNYAPPLLKLTKKHFRHNKKSGVWSIIGLSVLQGENKFCNSRKDTLNLASMLLRGRIA